MTVLSRGATGRRSSRRPSWLLLTALLVLALGASSVLVFTNRVDLLRLAVILALWASIIAAFVSLSYRREADVDKARARDLQRVYDLQLDREISARREYELSVESRLRHELASELQAQAADDVAALRAELAALRTSLEILFDTELDQRPALETDGAHRGYSSWPQDWSDAEDTAAERVSRNRVIAVREPVRQRAAANLAEETAIIDVPEEPLPLRPAVGDHAPAGLAPATEYEAGRDDDPRRRTAASDWHNWPTEPTVKTTEWGADEQRWLPSGQDGDPTEAGDAEPGELDETDSGSASPMRRRRTLPSTDDDEQVVGLDTEAVLSTTAQAGARHRTADSSSVSEGTESTGQSVAELLARLQAESGGTAGRRRRRRA
ncbi:MAG: hypothetical protein K2Q25_01790 [Mycobacteriaceae bacterium]|nr:hypothetical protein [Mycobacteriaceae bacterium]